MNNGWVAGIAVLKQKLIAACQERRGAVVVNPNPFLEVSKSCSSRCGGVRRPCKQGKDSVGIADCPAVLISGVVSPGVCCVIRAAT